MKQARFFGFAFTLLIGCGGANGPTGAPSVASPDPRTTPAATTATPTTSSAVAPTASAPPGRLGHYSSGDGMVGFVLDRMGPLPKIRMDGTTDMIELEPQNVKTEDHADFVNKKANVFVRLESSGRVTFVRGIASFDMKRDGDVDALPKLRLGHYSSGDGMTGFVLDRTGKKARMKMDGSNEVVEMEAEPASRDETSLTVHRRGVVLRLGTHGEVTFFRGNESINMRRDADAEPLK